MVSELTTAPVERDVTLDRASVEAYAAVIGGSVDGVAPVLLLASRAVLAAADAVEVGEVGALGVVHVAEDVVVARPLRLDVTYRTTTAVRHTAANALGSLVTLGHDVGDTARMTTTLLLRGHRRVEPSGSPPERPARPSAATTPVTLRYAVDADVASRYALVSGDHNPVHLDAEAARAAGFDGPIVHGMCTLAQATARLHVAIGPDRPVARVAVRFAKPVHPGDTVGVDGRFDGRSRCDFAARSAAGTCLKTGVLELR